MIRTLFIIAGAATVLCVGSLAGAAALGGHDLSRTDCTWSFTDDDGPGDRPEFGCGPTSPQATRAIDWSGGQELTTDLSADVKYVQGAKPGVVITGPKAIVDRVRLVDGRLTLADDGAEARAYLRRNHNGIRIWSENEMLRITVTAPNVNSFHIQGSGDLSVESYDQPTLGILVDGSGDIEVDGKAGKLDLRSNASGDADLEGLTVTDAIIDTTASGDVTVGPTGAVKVDMSGSGDVNLTRRPAAIDKNVSGSGDLEGV